MQGRDRRASVAQLDRAPGFEPGGWGFESLRAYSLWLKFSDFPQFAATSSPTDGSVQSLTGADCIGFCTPSGNSAVAFLKGGIRRPPVVLLGDPRGMAKRVGQHEFADCPQQQGRPLNAELHEKPVDSRDR